MLGIGIPGNGRAPARSRCGTAGRGSQTSASLPRCAMRGTSWGSLTPNSLSDWVLACPRQVTETSPGALPAPPGPPTAGSGWANSELVSKGIMTR